METKENQTTLIIVLITFVLTAVFNGLING